MNEPMSPKPKESPVYYVPVDNKVVGDEDEISLLDIIRIIARYRYFIVVISLICTLFGAWFAFTTTAVYRAETLLAPSQKESKGGLSSLGGQLGGLASMAGISLGGAADSTDEAIAILKSRKFTEKFINQENLMPLLFAKQWNAEKQQWYANAKPEPTMWSAYKLFNAIRQVNVDKRSNLITVSIEWHDAKIAALWANKLVTSLNADLRQRTIDEAEKSITYLNKQLAETSVMELHQVIYRLIEGQIKNIMLANSREQYAFKIIDPAVTPQIPTKPNKKVILVLSMVLGLFSALMLAFVHHWWKSLREAL